MGYSCVLLLCCASKSPTTAVCYISGNRCSCVFSYCLFLCFLLSVYCLSAFSKSTPAANRTGGVKPIPCNTKKSRDALCVYFFGGRKLIISLKADYSNSPPAKKYTHTRYYIRGTFIYPTTWVLFFFAFAC